MRAVIEFPLEDALLTEKQLMRCVKGLLQIIDEYDEMIRKAMLTGEVTKPERESPEEVMRLFMEFMRERKKGKEAVGASMGSIDLEE